MNGRQPQDLRWRYAGIVAATLIAVAVVYWYFCLGVTEHRTPGAARRPAGHYGCPQRGRHGPRPGAGARGGEVRYQRDLHQRGKSYAGHGCADGIAARHSPAALAAADVAGLVSTIRTSHYGQKARSGGPQ